MNDDVLTIRFERKLIFIEVRNLSNVDNLIKILIYDA